MEGRLLRASLLLVVCAWAVSSESNRIITRSPCPYLMHKCDDGTCIDEMKRCDGHQDCDDISDEKDCDRGDEEDCEGPDWFKCKGVGCIHSSFLCDGNYHCDDKSDEDNCNLGNTTHSAGCNKDEFTCDNGECVDKSVKCDSHYDCADLSDEIFCESDMSFRCKNGNHIIRHWVCDQKDDCKDGSDEENCEYKCDLNKGNHPCPGENKCITSDMVCDNIRDCADGSDESGGCHISCSTVSCTHGCIKTPKGPFCSCPKGYGRVNETSCRDLDECSLFHGSCSQKCTNYPGGYLCSCERGYTLQDDNRTCSARGEGLILYTTDDLVGGFFIKSEKSFPIKQKAKYPLGVSYGGEFVYWTEGLDGEEAIFRSHLNGSNTAVVVNSGIGRPEDIAVDLYTGNIYYTDSERAHIAVCSGDGHHCAILITHGMQRPRAIALDPARGKMYWTDWGDVPEIAKANMDGSDDALVVSENLRFPNGLALDQPSDRLYWVDAGTMTMESVRTDGSHRAKILFDLGHPYWIAVFENTLYWSSWNTDDLQICNKFSGKGRRTAIYKSKIYGIHIYHPVMEIDKKNPCQNSRCSHLCLLGKYGAYSCACPEGKRLDPDKISCSDEDEAEYLVIGNQNMLVTLHNRKLGRRHFNTTRLSPHKIDSMVYDGLNKQIIAYDNTTKQIYAVQNFDRSPNVQILVDINLGVVQGMDFDPMTNTLYWCDTLMGTVEVLSLSTRSRATLLQELGGDAVVDIALIPKKRIMVLALKISDGVMLVRTGMDGKERLFHITELKFQDTNMRLRYDQESDRVFISDSEKRNILFVNIRENERANIGEFVLNQEIGSMALSVSTVFWADKNFVFGKGKNDSISETPRKIDLDVPFDGKRIHLAAVVEPTYTHHECQHSTETCSHVCVQSSPGSHLTYTCLCPKGMLLKSDEKTCENDMTCSLDHFMCKLSRKCIERQRVCDRVLDCEHGEDEEDCSVSSKCKAGEFKCLSGMCVKMSEKCNQHHDCDDGSDETNCPNAGVKCRENEYRCKSGLCLSRERHLCNGKEECPDGDDEQDCKNNICPSNKFRCKSGTCIPKEWECDDTNDCPDNSDEHNNCMKHKPCDGGMFRCDNNKCIDGTLYCDRLDDCGDNSDESRCPRQHLHKCTDSQLTCSSDSKICLPNSARCNGTAECPKGEDEIGCVIQSNKIACHQSSQWKCKNNEKCIAVVKRCDGNPDCGDRSDEDEVECTELKDRREKCDSGFSCNNGRCISYNLLCDGKDDCHDGSDEGGSCENACSESFCDHECVSSPQGGVCTCGFGKKLASNGHSCDPLPPPCRADPPPCHHICTDTKDSFLCSCFDGYSLRSDNTSCKAHGEQMNIIFFANGELRRLSSRGDVLKILSKQTDLKPTSLAVYTAKSSIFYTVNGTGLIYHFDNEKNVTKSIKMGGNPYLLSIDWISENIYFINTRNGTTRIEVCNVNSHNRATIAHLQTETVTALKVDPLHGLLFYVTVENLYHGHAKSTIFKMNSDGSSKSKLLESDLSYYSGLAVDYENRLLYFADQEQNKIEKIDYDRNGRKLVVQDNAFVYRPVDLDVFENEIYFVLRATSKMGRCTLFGGTCTLIDLRAYGVENFALDQASKQKRAVNQCDAATFTCSHVCVTTLLGPKCICAGGTESLGNASCELDQLVGSEKSNSNESEGKSAGSTVVILVTVVFFLLFIALMFRYHKNQVRKSHQNTSLSYHGWNRDDDFTFSRKSKVHFHNDNLPQFGINLGGLTSKYPTLSSAMQNEYTNPLTSKPVDWPPSITIQSSDTHLQKTKMKKCQLEVPKLLADSDSDVESDRDFHESEQSKLLL